MKTFITLLSLLCFVQFTNGQATKAYPFAVGRTGCGSGTHQIHYYNYNGITNTIQNATGGLVAPCVPQLRWGLPVNGTQRFTSNLASVSFNPKDHNIYYLYTALTPSVRTYVWRWPVGTCPGTAANKLDTLRSFAADILGVAFDNNGNGYMLDFTGEPNGVPHKAMIRSIDFATGITGAADTLNLTGGAKIYVTGGGDVAMTPSGQMFFVVDNKMFTPNYSAYTGTGANITCTYIDTIKTTNSFVGLTYAEGETIAAYSGGGCPFQTIVPLPIPVTTTNTTKNNTPSNVNSTSDFATIVSGVGAAKRLVSVTPTGTANQYDVVYDIIVKNYGNMDITNLQVRDSLSLINGALNVSNVTVTIPVNPNGYTVNPLYTGIGPLATNYNLLSGTPTLPNYPVVNGTFTIRISCRLSNILGGVVYYNSATVTATDYNANSLLDRSTDGSNPDLNSNDKPDNTGESQPTPLLIQVVSISAPCVTLTNVLYAQNFGTGTGLATAIAAPVLGSGVSGPLASSLYTSSATQPIAGETYTITDSAHLANTANFAKLSDHTATPVNGRMLIVNADANNQVMYRGGFTGTLCANQQYAVSFYAAFPGGTTSYSTICDGYGGVRYPRIKVRIIDAVSGNTITESSTNFITNTTWQQYGIKFSAPASYSQIIFQLINDAPGGCGNDIAIDDIQFGSCDPTPVVGVSTVTGCLGNTSTLTGSLSDPGSITGTIVYQWQVASAVGGPYTDMVNGGSVSGVTTTNLVINPLAAADTGKYYRLLVAASGNMSNPGCRFNSPPTLLSGKAPSVAAATAIKNKNNICSGVIVNLGITGGTLGTNASWRWYTGSPGGTLVGTGSTLNVTPSVTTTYYVRAEGDCNTTADQSVTVFISCDIDKDKDGIPDYVESNIPAALANAYNTGYAGYKDNNNDFINDDFQADGDSDNDGLPNYLDPTFPGRVDTNADNVDDRFDADKDGIINMLDLDSDNDGIADVAEAYGVDTNGDGRIDSFTDTDGDGLSQNVDVNNTGANNTGAGLGNIDLDGDGVANFVDLDSDNDGIPDVVEVGGTDANNNGIIDGFVDVNTDGLHDGYINGTALLITGADGTADGRADTWPNKNIDRDLRPNAYDMDSDSDGIIDIKEAGLPDAVSPFGVIDGVIGTNGWSASVSSLPAINLPNTDGIGNPDYLDIDSDDDGIPDNIEGMTTVGYIRPTATTDTDGDGLVNHYDNVAGFGGTGIQVYDHDGDGTPDYRDLDTDADGVADIVEGNDFNLNGLSDDLVTLTGLDTDGDGLDNRFDSLNSVTNLKGTSYNMGNGGSTSGDAAPGSRSPVQKQTPAQIDRDWRFIGTVLPVQFINFAGTNQAAAVALNWSVITTKEVERFEIERSLDNVKYSVTGVVTDAVKLNEMQSFGFTDDISGINTAAVYYRLKVIGKAGDIKYSNVLVVRLKQNAADFVVSPNPAKNYTTIRFVAQQQTQVTIKLVDNSGKLVLQQKQNVLKGSNFIQLNDLGKFSNGIYTVQLLVNNEIFMQKLLLDK
jgi:Ig-like domain CHU_C associated/Secretion system C-terminal sorting domain